MLKANFITADEAARKVKDGDTVCSIAMTLVSVSESILKALEKRFLESGHPSNLTLLHSCGCCRPTGRRNWKELLNWQSRPLILWWRNIWDFHMCRWQMR